MADVRPGQVTILDRAKLCDFACFDPSYLFFD